MFLFPGPVAFITRSVVPTHSACRERLSKDSLVPGSPRLPRWLRKLSGWVKRGPHGQSLRLGRACRDDLVEVGFKSCSDGDHDHGASLCFHSSTCQTGRCARGSLLAPSYLGSPLSPQATKLKKEQENLLRQRWELERLEEERRQMAALRRKTELGCVGMPGLFPEGGPPAFLGFPGVP